MNLLRAPQSSTEKKQILAPSHKVMLLLAVMSVTPTKQKSSKSTNSSVSQKLLA